MSVIAPEIDELLAKVDSKYTLCIISARRARQINDMAHRLHEQALHAMDVTDIAKITSRKPLSKALEEIESGVVGYERAKDSYK